MDFMSGLIPPSVHTSLMPFGIHWFAAKSISMRDFFG